MDAKHRQVRVKSGKTNWALENSKGYIEYYLGYAGKVSPIINTFLKMIPITQTEYSWYMSIIIKCNMITFGNFNRNKHWFTDADGLGVSERNCSMLSLTDKILYNEAVLPFPLLEGLTTVRSEISIYTLTIKQ